MNLEVKANNLIKGSVKVLSSKSELHRLLILSSFAKTESQITYHGSLSDDVLATIGTLKAVGVGIEILPNALVVLPVKNLPKERVEINCLESGSTLRFILPVLSALGISYSVSVSGRLKDRPLSPLYEIMQKGGVTLTKKGEYPLSASGELTLNNITIEGGVSSQFISGLIMALAVSKKGGTVNVKGEFQSKPYVDITVDTARKFGIEILETENSYTINPTNYSGKTLTACGDWSNGAFFMSLGAIAGETETLGLDLNSKQGDKKIIELLTKLGARITATSEKVVSTKKNLTAITIDAKDIPDLIPVLSAVASVSNGTTTVINAERLRLKESDRIKSVVEMINSLGGTASETENGIIIEGKKKLSGGTVNGYNDHRIVMSSAILSAVCVNPVKIEGANAVNKSYPSFFRELENLGITTKEI